MLYFISFGTVLRIQQIFGLEKSLKHGVHGTTCILGVLLSRSFCSSTDSTT